MKSAVTTPVITRKLQQSRLESGQVLSVVFRGIRSDQPTLPPAAHHKPPGPLDIRDAAGLPRQHSLPQSTLANNDDNHSRQIPCPTPSLLTTDNTSGWLRHTTAGSNTTWWHGSLACRYKSQSFSNSIGQRTSTDELHGIVTSHQVLTPLQECSSRT